jgi:hypothetical protein
MANRLHFPDAASEQAWQFYVETEKQGSKKQRATALERFIEAICMAGRAARAEFVESYCRLYLDGIAPPPVGMRNGQAMRFPLFRRVFADVLESGRRSRKPGHARWCAQLHFLSVTGSCGTALDWPPRDILLSEALAIDPQDERARRLAVSATIADLRYGCHELPWGLAVEPSVMARDVDDLEKLLAGTSWAESSGGAIAALRRIIAGDRSDAAREAVASIFAVGWEIDSEFLREEGW